MRKLSRAVPALALVATASLALAPLPGPAQAQPVDSLFYQALSWRHLGPFRGGRSVAVAGVPSDPMTYYMGGVGSGVWKTTDGGQSWKHVSDDSFGTSSVGAIAVADSDPNVVYVGMGEHAVRGVMSSHGDGVYRSTDGGRSWTHLGLETTRHISRIRIHPSNPDIVYVAAQGPSYGESEDRGIYRSTDGGRSWVKVLYVGPTAGASELAMDRTNPRILYAAFWDHERYPWYVRSGGEGSGLWKSKDGGDSWTRIDEGLPGLMGKTAVDVSPANPDRLWAMVEADPGGGLYRSDDAGASWRLVSEDWALRARPWYYTEVFADPLDENTVYVLSAPMMRSVDGGRTFSRVATPHGDNHDLWINPRDPRVMINANDGGANISFNGGESWSTQDNQPTVQFYRVNTDHRFPYWVYGGQQDNTSVAIASWAAGGIGREDWHPVGGCESAIPAFDRDDPRYVYAGCYMGIMTEYDQATGASRNAQAYPVMPAALQAREMKYRFNWSAPILVSQFDPNTIYHGANVLLRSRDRGRSWEEASPDLTRAQEDKLGYGGGPITNEGAGGEIYGTLAYIAESPLQEGLLWTGSDDGLVHVTRDGGATWKNVTPEGLPEGLVNAVEPSPHDPARAYIAFTRYKFSDFTPYAFKTDDFGESWTAIADGIPPEHWVRVIREDPVRPGLLYAGTEAGVYVSFDDGASWHSLQLNLPLTPITDLQVQEDRNDLVASTGGWGFWALDDLSVLQQAEAAVGHRVHLFQNRSAYRAVGLGGGGGSGNTGENPPDGAILDFYLQEAPRGEVTLEILSEDGQTVRSFSTRPDTTAGEDSLTVRAGMNRLVWDLRYPDVYGVPGLYNFGSLQGRRVVPGSYTARLTVEADSADGAMEAGEAAGPASSGRDAREAGPASSGRDARAAGPASSAGRAREEHTAIVTVLKDPRVETTQQAYEEQDAFLREIVAETEALHRSVVRLRDVRGQIDAVLEQARDVEGTREVQERGAALRDSLTMVEDSLVQWKTYDGQTVLNAPSRINFQYLYLMGAVSEADGGVNDGAREVFRDLNARWHPLRDRLEALLDRGVAGFNAAVREAGIPPVIVRRGPGL